RKKMENKILQQNEFLNNALEALTHPFYVIDADDYTIQLANSATGFSNLAENRTCYQVTHKRKKPCSADHPCPLEIVKKTKKPAVTEHIHIDKNGNKRNVEIHAYPIFDNDGNIVQMIEYCLDITERTKVEEALKETLTKLETLNEKLGVVGRLTRHDVRNKLSVIVNNVYLAKQRLAGDQVGSGYLEGIESAVNQVEKILNFASNYEKLGVETLSYIDVGKCVEEAVVLFSGLDGIRLVNECHDLTVLADSLLRQLVYNLMHNSVVHGERVDQISVYCKEGKDQLKLIYEDNGVGIPEVDKEKIFMEGYGKGTGYGLYLIKKTCEAYGWVIQETGVPGKGTQFTIHPKN
ncbi:PAS domain-containing sensor histidine kinase, partial [Candidatus Bathyarchaeota archaeon]|nr:PAS domain-containing sensor histidine kinase [Candidatus Bathyarchaeota archaeon]